MTRRKRRASKRLRASSDLHWQFHKRKPRAGAGAGFRVSSGREEGPLAGDGLAAFARLDGLLRTIEGLEISRTEARRHLNLPENEKLLLFFGFIRKYKGLDLLLEAMARLTGNEDEKKIRLLVAGEFYEDEKGYQRRIEELGIGGRLILRTDFIPDSEVRYFLCAADAVVQPYRNATQSGVTPLAYHFERPMIVTNVGGLPALVPHEKVGLVVPPTPEGLADGIRRFYQLGEDYFIPHLRSEKEKYSWKKLVETLLGLTRASQD